jgi:hypothetical protein
MIRKPRNAECASPSFLIGGGLHNREWEKLELLFVRLPLFFWGAREERGSATYT